MNRKSRLASLVLAVGRFQPPQTLQQSDALTGILNKLNTDLRTLITQVEQQAVKGAPPVIPPESDWAHPEEMIEPWQPDPYQEFMRARARQQTTPPTGV